MNLRVNWDKVSWLFQLLKINVWPRLRRSLEGVVDCEVTGVKRCTEWTVAWVRPIGSVSNTDWWRWPDQHPLRPDVTLLTLLSLLLWFVASLRRWRIYCCRCESPTPPHPAISPPFPPPLAPMVIIVIIITSARLKTDRDVVTERGSASLSDCNVHSFRRVTSDDQWLKWKITCGELYI